VARPAGVGTGSSAFRLHRRRRAGPYRAPLAPKLRGKRFDELTPAQRRTLPIALKKLRYTLEFLQGLFDRRKVKAFMNLLGRL
jgi:hypothetical protein